MRFLIISIVSFTLVGCGAQGIRLDLDWHAPSTQARGLVPSGANASVVPFESIGVESFGCLHVDDIMELREALRRGNIGEANFRKVAVALEHPNPNEAAADADQMFEELEDELDDIISRIRN